MKIHEILDQYSLEEVYSRAYKRTGKQSMKLGVRCATGPKAGKWVSDPSQCNKRKDWKKVISGRKVMRTKGGLIHHKSEITRRGAFSKIIKRVNSRLSGKSLRMVGPKDVEMVE